MNLSSAEISAWIGSFLWPFFRIGAMLMAAPVFGTRTVPRRVRFGIAVVLTATIAPLLPPMPVTDPLSPGGILVIVQQVLIGVALGFMLRVAFTVFELVGEMVSHLMGLGFASMIDPQNGVSVPVLGQFYVLLATLVFLSLNGHLLWIEVVADSFRTLPVGAAGLEANGAWAIVSFGGSMFAWAMQLALPVVAALLVINVSFGVLTRAAPQLNLFSVGFPASMLLGFVLVAVSLPAVLGKVLPISLDALAHLGAVLGGR
jgi:flagellar biosynthesis protein FliR